MINDNWSEPDDDFQPYTPHTALERRVAALEARVDRLELDLEGSEPVQLELALVGGE